MKKWIVSLAVLGAFGFAFTPQLAADHHEQGGMEMPEEMKAEMEMWMKLAEPGPEHENMAKFAGTWDAAVKIWASPDAPPMETKSRSENSMILGGRYLMQKYSGDMMGMPLEGFSIMGYDNYKKEYVSFWIDNMSTMVMTMNGKPDDSGKVITQSGSYPNPMTGGEDHIRSVSTMKDENTLLFEMYKKSAGADEFKSMEITYTRAGEAAKKAGY